MKRAKFNEIQAARTDWFPVKVKPVRPGVYETRYYAGGLIWVGRSRWNGSRWSSQGGAMHYFTLFRQDKEWRGLAADPAAPAVRRPGLEEIVRQVLKASPRISQEQANARAKKIWHDRRRWSAAA